jgi:endonuclease/exonuclease/phosphatase family metal-dependent hydrolase
MGRQALVTYELSRRVRVATYNVHDCIGRDGIYDPDRIAAVIASLDADLVALQEITLDHAGDVVRLIETGTHMRAVDGTLFERGIGRYGNLLLTRLPLVGQQLHDVSFAGREPRGVIEAQVLEDGRQYSVFATHLGLVRHERRRQIATIAALLASASQPTILMGDLNAWMGNRPLRPLFQAGLHGAAVRSFPSRPFPLLALDRILVSEVVSVAAIRRVGGPVIGQASDHLPVVADISVAHRPPG